MSQKYSIINNKTMCDCRNSFHIDADDGRIIIKCGIKRIDDYEIFLEMQAAFEERYPGHHFVPNDECQFFYNEEGQPICPYYEPEN